MEYFLDFPSLPRAWLRSRAMSRACLWLFLGNSLILPDEKPIPWNQMWIQIKLGWSPALPTQLGNSSGFATASEIFPPLFPLLIPFGSKALPGLHLECFRVEFGGKPPLITPRWGQSDSEASVWHRGQEGKISRLFKRSQGRCKYLWNILLQSQSTP